MFESMSNLSLVVQILAIIILVTTAITLVIAVFSYIGYKLRTTREPEALEGIPDFFVRYVVDSAPAGPGALPPPANQSRPPEG